jgi:hypothetical protein
VWVITLLVRSVGWMLASRYRSCRNDNSLDHFQWKSCQQSLTYVINVKTGDPVVFIDLLKKQCHEIFFYRVHLSAPIVVPDFAS